MSKKYTERKDGIKSVTLVIDAYDGRKLEIPLEVWQVDVIREMLGLSVDTTNLDTYCMPNLNYDIENIDISDVKSDVNVWNQIKEAIDENPKVTQRELVSKLDVSFRQIQQNMAEMISAGEISRIGSNRGGYWEVLK